MEWMGKGIEGKDVRREVMRKRRKGEGKEGIREGWNKCRRKKEWEGHGMGAKREK